MKARWRIRRWATLLIAVEAVMLVAAIAVGVVGLTQLTTARQRVVDQIDPELLEAHNLTAALLNQETGQRGYLLTGQRPFRVPYDEGKQEQDRAVAELRRLGAVDGTNAGRDLDIVLTRAQAWQRTAEQMIDGSTPVSTALVDRGKAQFDAVRASLDIQQANLTAARQVDRRNLDQAATLLGVMLAVTTVLLVILFVFLALGFHRRIVRPILGLAGEVRAATDDISRRIPTGDGTRELAELANDVEALRQRIVSEVSELHRAHTMLDTRTRELERSNSDLEQFAYVASHDLQEPLRKVTSFCQLIQRRYQGKLDERGEQYIEFAVDGARRMQILINDLLAFSRVGRRPAEFAEVDTGELVRTAIGNLDPADAEITQSELPTVRGEASLLTAVFQNLLSNAIKFRGEQPPRIHVDAERTGDDWTFSVTDNGIGIDDEYAERIFVIFQRLHPRDAYPGTGIGLAMTRKIIEYHHGRVWLDTGAGDGQTRFRFTLPASGQEEVDQT
jgi:signal transduction histidine kinase